MLFVFLLLAALLILVSLLLARVGPGGKDMETGRCGQRDKLGTRTWVKNIHRTKKIVKNFLKSVERFASNCFSFVRTILCVWENFIQLE